MSTLEGQSPTRFLRAHWLSKVQQIPERRLYKAIKAYIHQYAVSPIAFLDELNDSAGVYVSIVSPIPGSSVAADLLDLVAMRSAQGVPFLMAVKATLDTTKFERALQVVQVLLTRNIIVAGRNPNELEGVFSRWAIGIRANSGLDPVLTEARQRTISDDLFRQSFLELEDLPTPQARYLLRRIEFYQNAETTLMPESIDIEHILPQNPTDEWVEALGVSEDEARSAAKRFGNLTLLGRPINQHAATKPFRRKCDEDYQKSEIQMTKNLCALDNWNIEKIEERQEELADRALSVWKL